MMGLPSLPRLGLLGHRKCGVEAGSLGGVRDPDPMGEMLLGAPEPEGIIAPDTEPELLVVPVVPGLVMMVPRLPIPSWPRPGPGSMVCPRPVRPGPRPVPDDPMPCIGFHPSPPDPGAPMGPGAWDGAPGA